MKGKLIKMDKNNFAKTPPMGWNSYDYYDTTATEEDLLKNACVMAEQLKPYGYEYIVCDISWYAEGAGRDREHYQYLPFDTLSMDAFSRLTPDPVRFPSSADGSGFTKIAEKIHALGLKFGIHIMRGIPRKAAHDRLPLYGGKYTADLAADPGSICPWNPYMYGVRDNAAGQCYYDSLLSLYAAWGVDFIKCDDIAVNGLYRNEYFSGWHEIRMLHEAIEKCGRPIVLSLSPGPAEIGKAFLYEKNANMWRMTGDFWDDWDALKRMFERCELWQDHVKEGCFPDCDMLPLGMVGKGFGEERRTRFSLNEAKTMMTLFCFFRSPLMIGAELTKLDAETMLLLTNRALLSCLQDGSSGREIYRDASAAAWKNTDASGNVRIALFNLEDEEKTLSLKLSDLEEALPENALLTEIFEHTEAQFKDGVLTVVVPAHGVRAYFTTAQV